MTCTQGLEGVLHSLASAVQSVAPGWRPLLRLGSCSPTPRPPPPKKKQKKTNKESRIAPAEKHGFGVHDPCRAAKVLCKALDTLSPTMEPPKLQRYIVHSCQQAAELMPSFSLCHLQSSSHHASPWPCPCEGFFYNEIARAHIAANLPRTSDQVCRCAGPRSLSMRWAKEFVDALGQDPLNDIQILCPSFVAPPISPKVQKVGSRPRRPRALPPQLSMPGGSARTCRRGQRPGPAPGTPRGRAGRPYPRDTSVVSRGDIWLGTLWLQTNFARFEGSKGC